MNNQSNPIQNGASPQTPAVQDDAGPKNAAPQKDDAKIEPPQADAAPKVIVTGDPVQDDVATKSAPLDGTTVAAPTKSV
jgi:hypothetical protein